MKGELNCCPVLLIIVRVLNEWRASCKPLSGFLVTTQTIQLSSPSMTRRAGLAFTGVDAKRRCQRYSPDR